ncbi:MULTISPECIES: hypothetical protein [unclassified Brenneria]|nr:MULTISPECIES: hypothetical protein [unclassified Brenneria]MDX5627105.1 hypothetical protein [Brenneria sp. L3-3Z]MDX5693545.1 hypothetical protein [Brenneria sp. L4-2C]
MVAMVATEGGAATAAMAAMAAPEEKVEREVKGEQVVEMGAMAEMALQSD